MSAHDKNYDDCFSKQAADYAKFRPHHPEGLFEFLATFVPKSACVWDCGTGSGQAATSLARYFESIIATDVNPHQLAHAFPHPKITYREARAEASGLPSRSIDLVTVANAVHWFDLPLFYAEVKRVLRPGGIFAMFQNGHQRVSEGIDAILFPFERELLKGYWTERNWLAVEGYSQFPFPFERIASPHFEYALEWNLDELHGFFSSWSAVQKYKDRNGEDPFAHIETPLRKAWGDPETKRTIRWDLDLHVGR